MAKLEQLLPLFSKMTEAEQEQFVRQYRNKRLLDIDTYVAAESKSRKSAPKFTEEEKALMKMLGITPKALAAMKTIEEPEEDDDEDDDGLGEDI